MNLVYAYGQAKLRVFTRAYPVHAVLCDVVLCIQGHSDLRCMCHVAYVVLPTTQQRLTFAMYMHMRNYRLRRKLIGAIMYTNFCILPKI